MGQEMSPTSSSTLWIDHASGGTTYMTARHGLGTLYSGLTDAAKTQLFTLAQQMIQYCGRFVWYDAAGVRVSVSGLAISVSQAMKDAVCEQAVALMLDPDLYRRMTVRMQGVTNAGIVQESYGGAGMTVPISPAADMLLRNNTTKNYANPDWNSFEVVR